MIAAKWIAAACAAALLGVTATASATEFESNGKTAEVRFHDLDLSKPKDQHVLKARIWRAAYQVCADGPTTAAVNKCQSVAAIHVRNSVELAIAKAGNGDRYADMNKEKPVGAGN